MVRALSLWQPWAAMVVSGAKRWETRGWATAYRGPLAIHAAKSRTYVPASARSRFVFGALIGFVQLGRVLPVEVVRDRLSAEERGLGDYRDGRYAWEMLEPWEFREPVPYRGWQRLFWVPRSEVPIAFASAVPPW